jgi:hypothetical protein
MYLCSGRFIVSPICNVTNPLTTLWYYYFIDKPCYHSSPKKKNHSYTCKLEPYPKINFPLKFFSFLQNLLQKYSHMFSLLAKQKGLLPITPYQPHKKQNTTHTHVSKTIQGSKTKFKKYIFSLNNHILIKFTYGFVNCLTYSKKMWSYTCCFNIVFFFLLLIF